jgi:hypothetical protein
MSPAESFLGTGNAIFLGTINVSANGVNLIPTSYPGPSITSGTGSMTLTPVGAGDEADVRFSVSLFSDSSPFVMTGSYGASAVPVTLRVDQITLEVTAPSDPAARIPLTPLPAPPFPMQVVVGLSAMGTIRGALTVGATTVPFSETTTGCCGSSDAALGGGLDFGIVSPDRTVVGYGGGPGILSSFGVGFSKQDLITIDGVTFSTNAFSPTFYDLLYVPEPGSAALLALAGGSLVALRARRRVRSRD